MEDFSFETVLVYLNDIIIFSRESRTFEYTVQHLNSQLTQCGLRLKPSKRRLMRKKIHYLGHIVEAALHSFLHLVGYNQQFIPKCAQNNSPLTQLLSGPTAQKKGQSSPSIQSQWQKPQKQAFEPLKQILTSAPLLTYADYSKTFKVYTERSLQGLGAVVAQEQNR